jgi:hypothetical protein
MQHHTGTMYPYRFRSLDGWFYFFAKDDEDAREIIRPSSPSFDGLEFYNGLEMGWTKF